MKSILKGSIIVFWLLLLCSTGSAETKTPFLGLLPGTSNRTDVDRALGPPVRSVSETLLEYSGGDRALKIYAQYLQTDGVVQRIEVFLASSSDRSSVQRLLSLPSDPDQAQVNAKNKLEEYYGDPRYVVLTYTSATEVSGIERIGYYSRTLYEIAVTKAQQRPKSTPQPAPVGSLPVPANPGVFYDQSLSEAWNAMLAKDFSKALNLLQQAIRANPDRGAAYNLRGQAYLYGYNDVASAETSMREAIAKNDNASFRLHHDHSGTFQQFCYGWLSISKTEVSFKSDDGHGFQWTKEQLREIKINDLMGVSYSAFHIKGPGGNYNFAPGTLKRPEANLILTLIGE